MNNRWRMAPHVHTPFSYLPGQAPALVAAHVPMIAHGSRGMDPCDHHPCLHTYILAAGGGSVELTQLDCSGDANIESEGGPILVHSLDGNANLSSQGAPVEVGRPCALIWGMQPATPLLAVSQRDEVTVTLWHGIVKGGQGHTWCSRPTTHRPP